MKANPGGQIDLRAVMGRDRLIANFWDMAEQQSLIITAERRIGKTTVMKKMEFQPREGWAPVYQDLENCHSAMEFALAVQEQVSQFLSLKGKTTKRAKELLKALGGLEIGRIIKLPEMKGGSWKEVLTRTVEDLIQENDTSSKLLFLWDEMPFMLMNIRDREGELTAMEVLDHLRWLRQTHPGLRMVITGSIGLHHVITSLKDSKYANAPLNDMAALDVPPLAGSDARLLAAELIRGESLRTPDEAAAAAAIAHEADCFPFYIHHIVRGLRIQELDATPENVARVVASHLTDANDPWQLTHYRDRISTYYPGDAKAVLLILDTVAAPPETAGIAETGSVNALLQILRATSLLDDRERLLRLLSLLERDHYLKRNPDGLYQFRFPLIRRWWKLNRGL